MIEWKKLNADINKGIKEGLDAAIVGAKAAKVKADELTKDVKKKIEINEIKKKIKEDLAEIGARMYQLEKKSPGSVTDAITRSYISKIDMLEKELKDLEG